MADFDVIVNEGPDLDVVVNDTTPARTVEVRIAGEQGPPGPPGTTDHDALANVRPADPLSTDVTRNRHVSDADEKANVDHRGNTNNPHATTAAQVGAVATGDHTKAAHDALLIDAATVDGIDSTGFAPIAHVGSRSGADGHPVATPTLDGFESAADKAKLDGIETGATADQSAAEILAATKTVDGAGSGLDADLLDGIDSAGFAPASHVGSGGTAHAEAVAGGAAGFLSGNDKLKLDQLPLRYYTAPGFIDYDLVLAATTWTRLNNGTVNAPQISVPALPSPPSGMAWRLRVGRFGYVTTPGAATVFFNASINAGALSPLHGGGYISAAAADIKPIDTVLTPPTGAAFTVDFAIYASVAGTYKIMGNGGVSPSALLYLVAV